MSGVRLAGTAIVCIVAAFGAAFLVARAVKHETPARAASPPRTTRVADAVTTRTTTDTHANAELVSQFTPVRAALKHRPKPHHRHHQPQPKPAPAVVPATQTPTPATTPTTPVATTTTTTPAPVYSTPAPAPVHSAPAPTHSSSGSTQKKKSSGGSGTTTIGG